MSLAVVTPSYRNDLALFSDSHRSVMRFTDEKVRHYVVVPRRDVELFAATVGPRCVIVPEESLYPAHYKPIRGINRFLGSLPHIPSHARIAAINTQHLLRPIRGWMIQQALKLEICRQLEIDTVLLIDSDVELVRRITEESLRLGEHARLYRCPGRIDTNLPLHMEWVKISRQLLGLPPVSFPASDYVSSLCVWEPSVVRAMLARVGHATSLHWMDAIIGQRTFSEWILYGVFAEDVLKYDESSMTDSSLCHSYWGNVPLTMGSVAEFVSQINSKDVAILIQSKSGTPGAVRRAAIDAITTGVNIGNRSSPYKEGAVTGRASETDHPNDGRGM